MGSLCVTACESEIKHLVEADGGVRVDAASNRNGNTKSSSMRGRKVNGTHWSRLVANDIKTYSAPEPFAATPPMDALKYPLRRFAQDLSKSTIHVDMTQANCYAKARRDIYVRLPVEDQQEGREDMCGQLSRGMYGTRDVAQDWQSKCSEPVREIGFDIGKASPCHYFKTEWGVCGMVHGDDFVSAGKDKFSQIADYMMGKPSVNVAAAGPKENRQFSGHLTAASGGRDTASSTIATTDTPTRS